MFFWDTLQLLFLKQQKKITGLHYGDLQRRNNTMILCFVPNIGASCACNIRARHGFIKNKAAEAEVWSNDRVYIEKIRSF
mmetsp:Transcript_27147/g.35595  ORF Transcript_27147/g.35595 Transcript_27147/m.35595 type:complete len:80 (-) Transcript_27147:6-245(-)